MAIISVFSEIFNVQIYKQNLMKNPGLGKAALIGFYLKKENSFLFEI